MPAYGDRIARLLPHMPQAVVFDMDGLLLDTETLYRQAHQLASAALGYPMSDALHGTLIGVPRDQTEVRLAEAFGPAFDLRSYDARFQTEFARLCEGGIPLRPGVHALLDALDRHRLPHAVATSTGQAARHTPSAGGRDPAPFRRGRDPGRRHVRQTASGNVPHGRIENTDAAGAMPGSGRSASWRTRRIRRRHDDGHGPKSASADGRDRRALRRHPDQPG